MDLCVHVSVRCSVDNLLLVCGSEFSFEEWISETFLSETAKTALETEGIVSAYALITITQAQLERFLPESYIGHVKYACSGESWGSFVSPFILLANPAVCLKQESGTTGTSGSTNALIPFGAQKSGRKLKARRK